MLAFPFGLEHNRRHKQFAHQAHGALDPSHYVYPTRFYTGINTETKRDARARLDLIHSDKTTRILLILA